MSQTAQIADAPRSTLAAPRVDLAAVLLAMIFPSLATWLYFVAFAGSDAMQWIYGGSKFLQFAFPALWVIGVRRRIPQPRWNHGAGVALGLVFGAVAAAAMVAAYGLLAGGSTLLDAGIAAVQQKATEIGAHTPARFLALAAFYALVHSLMEEYFWRWYAFGELRRFLGDRAAIVLSSLGFMAHHVIVVGLYFRENWWLMALLSLSVAVGGAFWAWLYRRSGTLFGPWFSHALVDAGIMAVGYWMIFGR